MLKYDSYRLWIVNFGHLRLPRPSECKACLPVPQVYYLMYVSVDLGDAKNDAVKYRVYCGHLFYMRGQYQFKRDECLKFKEVKFFRLGILQIIFMFVFCFFSILAFIHMDKSNYEKTILISGV